MTYTREQILSMPAGKELDKIAAEEVIGCKCYYPAVFGANTSLPGTTKLVALPDYSTEIVAARDLEKKIKQFGGLMIGYYMTELQLICGNNGFDMVHATPEQRTKAAILAMMESGGTGDE